MKSPPRQFQGEARLDSLGVAIIIRVLDQFEYEVGWCLIELIGYAATKSVVCHTGLWRDD